ncbi:TetR family transcriptional regulator [Martelella mediterranea]|uniref:TetR/AcrR family transcriptional regulator n=1 Tax=Martelella mediterranea TaxID=293089 RepID=UPI001E4518BA|nr:TetR/AcrR family transcriptional regulator [Martelella mediterranea]MCD1634794.1 TetR family transcriptional regulator [Martelella mediterranea]
MNKADTTARPETRRRPQKRDTAATRLALLHAAVAEFTEFGYEGGRVDRIAKNAGVNKQLVYHHFGSKADLYRATLEEVYREIREREQQLHLDELEPEDAMRALIGFSFDYLSEHPEFVTLLNDENRMEAYHLKMSDKITDMHSPLVQIIEETLDRGVAVGIFNNRFDPVDLYLSIAGLTFFYFANRHTLSVIFNRDMTTARHMQQRRAHIIDFVLSSLRN